MPQKEWAVISQRVGGLEAFKYFCPVHPKGNKRSSQKKHLTFTKLIFTHTPHVLNA